MPLLTFKKRMHFPGFPLPGLPFHCQHQPAPAQVHCASRNASHSFLDPGSIVPEPSPALTQLCMENRRGARSHRELQTPQKRGNCSPCLQLCPRAQFWAVPATRAGPEQGQQSWPCSRAAAASSCQPPVLQQCQRSATATLLQEGPALAPWSCRSSSDPARIPCRHRRNPGALKDHHNGPREFPGSFGTFLPPSQAKAPKQL